MQSLTLPDFLLLSLATWRLAFLLAREHGPKHILDRLRAVFHLPECVYCLSIWLAPLLYLVYGTEARPVVYVLAIAGGAIFAHRWTGGDHV